MAKRIFHQAHATLHLVGLSHTASSRAEWVPNTDVYENETSFIIRMEIAGVKREDIQIHLAERALIVSGRRFDPCRVSQCHFRQMEINYGLFEKRLIIPRNVDGKSVKANYENGFLIIDLPKTPKSTPTQRKVPVQD